ncbi:hypothetical protein PsYK624_032760 [Phanerochaete sordida]|uniref:Sfi1 spindle body domain-containing protein n=1 Tax=Phanerochaete sordida TaxID=48140 RepID=A0A9P3LAP4_9APHY|nr:hypothetical protein PsYK624_032760 [Phanerochaete sordida]
MSRFRPPRASSPPKPSKHSLAALSDILEISSSSSLQPLCPELATLTPDEVNFIDALLERVSANASPSIVFNAHGELSKERGLEPDQELAIYRKLLKVLTRKGRNFGEKWDTARQQLPFLAGPSRPRTTTEPPPRSVRPLASTSAATTHRAQILSRLTGTLKAFERDDDAFTLHSHQEDATDIQSEAPTEAETEADQTYRAHAVRTSTAARRPVSPTITMTTNSLGLSTAPPPPASTARSRTLAYQASLKRAFPTRAPAAWDAETSEATADTARASSSIPPSYGAATREIDPPVQSLPKHTPLRALAKAQSKAIDTPPSPTTSHYVPVAAARAAITQARERRGTVLNEDEAWKKIRIARYEEDADRFRDEKLLERYWEAWRAAYQWVETTAEQIAEARNLYLVRDALHRWRSATAAQRDLYARVAATADNRRLKAVLQLWRGRLRERKQLQWRQDMRARMKAVRDGHDRALVRGAYEQWRQAFRLRLAEQQYYRGLATRVFKRWRSRLVQMDQIEDRGDQLVALREKRQLARFWDLWRKEVAVRRAEGVLTRSVGLRILTTAFDAWKQRLHEVRLADDFHDHLIVKRALRSWKTARDRIRTLERRAAKHEARQNEVLLRAVWRVWKAHERGRLVENAVDKGVLHRVWSTWVQRLQQHREREAKALAFSTRGSSALAVSAMRRWREVHTSHQNAQAFAVQYYNTQLAYRMLFAWRLQLRAHAKQARQARHAEKYFVTRSAWHKWVEKAQEKKRERKVKEFEERVAGKYLREWCRRAQVERQMKLSEEVIRKRVELRIMSNALNRWTNRVADVKFREFETQKRYETAIVTSAFNKWKALCIRHVNDLSLMESYKYVKREETLRKVFYRWLSLARKTRSRRQLLQQKEEELKLAVVAGAWDKWRERYLDIRLQPVADAFLAQHERNLVFRAFGIWHSKTKSLPAVRFHASHLKGRYWAIWRDAMPRALQSKQARELHQKNVLTKAFEKWVQAYRTKLELKAVARARYLRLPTAAPRQTRSAPPPKPSTAPPDYISVPTVGARPDSPASISEAGPSSPPLRPAPAVRSKLYQGGRLSIASLLSERPRSPERRPPPKLSTQLSTLASPSRPRLSTRASTVRNTSPARSTSTYGGATKRSELASKAPSTKALSTYSGDVGRGRLWQELKNVRVRSRHSNDGARSRLGDP